MAIRLPDVGALGDRPIPRANNDIHALRGGGAMGDALAEAGRSVSNYANEKIEEQDKLETTYATAAFLKGQSEWLSRDDREYETMSKRYGEDVGSINDNGEFKPGKLVTSSAEQIKSAEKRKAFIAGASLYVARGMEDVRRKEKSIRSDVGLAKLDEQFQSLSEAYQQATDPLLKAQIAANFAALTDSSKQFMGDNAEQQSQTLKRKFVEDNSAIAWASRPDAEKLEILKKSQGGDQPLSVRNNNPGNLRDSKTGQFRVFNTPEEGKAAMESDLRTKITGKSDAMKAKFGKAYSPTLENVIATWAPTSENDTSAYIQTVSKETGLAPDAPLNESDIAKVMPAMIKVEGGGKATGYFGKTGTEFDFLSQNEKAKWMAPDTKKKIASNIADNDMAKDPVDFVRKIDDGAYNDYFDEADKKKYKAAAFKIFDGQQEQAKMERVATAADANRQIYDKFLANDPNILNDIAAFRENGGDAELADYMRDAALKANPISAEEQNETYSELFDEVSQLQLKTKNGKIKIGKDDVALEDLLRLQQRIMKESARGVKGLKSLNNRITPAILQLSGRELGNDDVGLFDGTEAYDEGYQVIQDYLEKQEKEDDFALKSDMLSSFVAAADSIPENVRADQGQFDAALTSAANRVIANASRKGMPNIPITAIQHLKANPATKTQFDEIFGVGSADKILGGNG